MYKEMKEQEEGRKNKDEDTDEQDKVDADE